MVQYLLDTHIWLWYLVGDSRLRARHRRMMQDPAAEIWLSAISIWEASLLIERKRFRVRETPGAWIRRALQILPVREAPVTFRVAAVSREMAIPHGDPADRFIAATAAVMDVPLLTADEALIGCPDIVCR
jgi:PIN domain nuclease of toxin-antitoxin system